MICKSPLKSSERHHIWKSKGLSGETNYVEAVVTKPIWWGGETQSWNLFPGPEMYKYKNRSLLPHQTQSEQTNISVYAAFNWTQEI